MAKRTKQKTNKKQTKVSSTLKTVSIILLIVVIVSVAIYFTYKNYDEIKLYIQNYIQSLKNDDNDPPVIVSGELSIHFINFNTDSCGDSIYIKAGDTDIIVDSGPLRSSSNDIYDYIVTDNNFITDGIVEFAIVTHADQDHIAGFAGSNTAPSLFDRFEVQTIIDFPLTDKTTVIYNDYITKRDAEVINGATRYSALECYNQTNGGKRVYDLSESVKLEILYNYYYENRHTDENNYSVCFLLKHGERNFLFTGDLEIEGEEKLVEYNTLPEVELFKAGHHGSKTSSNDCLLEVIKPKICVACCCAGSSEYTNIHANMFPTQDFITRIAKYTEKVYITSCAEIEKVFEADGVTEVLDRYGYPKYKVTSYGPLNGNIVISSTVDKVEVNCSASNLVLKDTDWFKNNWTKYGRTIPTQWAS